MKYMANPVVVDARVILDVAPKEADGSTAVTVSDSAYALEGGSATVVLTAEMTARHHPEPGDYLVAQADGYLYVNPRAVFERKYRQLASPSSLMSQLSNIARVCHEANRAYCVSLGDYSQKPWDNAPLWQRESALSGVKFAILNPGSAPADSHANWLRDKERDSWKWGPVKDVTTREHPCMVPYHQLPATQRRKDSLFLAVVGALTELTELPVGEAELKAGPVPGNVLESAAAEGEV
jgi:hypothetical protein